MSANGRLTASLPTNRPLGAPVPARRREPALPHRRLALSWPTVALACSVGVVLAAAALIATVGADARWLAAMGRLIVARHGIPNGVPFAPGASAHWPNVPVLAELVFNWLTRAMGDRGLMVAQLAAVAVAMGALIRDSLAGGAERLGTSRALLIAGLGSLPALAIARSQLFSLALFPVLCLLLRSEARRPSWRIWLAVPLLAVWSNLHGAALVGAALLLAYLLISRLREQPLVSISVAVAGVAALCVTPALLRTVDYYHGVLTNQAAASGQGLWGSLSLTSPLDVLFIVSAIILFVQFLRARPARWELAGAAGLALMTVVAGRNGLWLVLFLVPAAARSFAPRRQWPALIAPLALASAVVLVFAFARGPVLRGATAPVLTRAISLAHGSPILAQGELAEQVALDGGSIVAGDPIDAFSPRVQRAYLGWLAGSRAALHRLDAGVRVVLVQRGTGTQHLMARAAGFTAVGGDRQVLLYERRP